MLVWFGLGNTRNEYCVRLVLCCLNNHIENNLFLVAMRRIDSRWEPAIGPSKSYLIFGFGGKVYALIMLMSGWSGIPGIFKEAGRQMLLGSTEMLLETIKGEGVFFFWLLG
jgi:hypothetical protein